LKLAEARSSVCETLDRSGYVEHCGPVSANRTVADLLADPFNTPVIAGPVS
jgi:hypothetical protein